MNDCVWVNTALWGEMHAGRISVDGVRTVFLLLNCMKKDWGYADTCLPELRVILQERSSRKIANDLRRLERDGFITTNGIRTDGTKFQVSINPRWGSLEQPEGEAGHE